MGKKKQGTSPEKRQRERDKMMKRREKSERRQQRKEEKERAQAFSDGEDSSPGQEPTE